MPSATWQYPGTNAVTRDCDCDYDRNRNRNRANANANAIFPPSSFQRKLESILTLAHGTKRDRAAAMSQDEAE